MGTGLLPTPHICTQLLRHTASHHKAFITLSLLMWQRGRMKTKPGTVRASPVLSRLPLLGAQQRVLWGCCVLSSFHHLPGDSCNQGGGGET